MEKRVRLIPKKMAHAFHAEGNVRRAEQPFAEADAAVDRGKMDRPECLVEQLRDGLVESQHDRGEETQDGRRPEDRKKGARAADSEGERDFFWSYPLRQLRDDRLADAALPEGARRRRRGGRRMIHASG